MIRAGFMAWDEFLPPAPRPKALPRSAPPRDGEYRLYERIELRLGCECHTDSGSPVRCPGQPAGPIEAA